jgi:hypothetical protein
MPTDVCYWKHDIKSDDSVLSDFKPAGQIGWTLIENK